MVEKHLTKIYKLLIPDGLCGKALINGIDALLRPKVSHYLQLGLILSGGTPRNQVLKLSERSTVRENERRVKCFLQGLLALTNP